MIRNKEVALVFMAAGISSRFKGKIKQFAKIGPNNETLIEYSINQAIKSGFSKIIFIVGSKTELPFKEIFKSSYRNIPVYYALQSYNENNRCRPWGTGDALCSAKDLLDCPFVVCNGDDIYGEKAFKILFNHLIYKDEEATLGYKLKNVLPGKGLTHRAIFKTNGNYVVVLKEVFNIDKNNLNLTKSKPDDLCSMNIFALHPKTLDFLNKNLIEFKKKNINDDKIEFLLPNELSRLIKHNKIKMKVYKTDEAWFGITNPEDEEIVRTKLKIISKNI